MLTKSDEKKKKLTKKAKKYGTDDIPETRE